MNLDEYLMKELNISKKEAYQISYAVNKYTKEKKKIKLNIKLPTMIILYVMSCIYHALPPSLEGKKVLRVIDHCNVFLLVYGTYIPMSLVGVGGKSGLALFIAITIITIIGVLLTAIKIDKTQVLQVICHLLSGWGALFFISQLKNSLGINGLILLIIGGVM